MVSVGIATSEHPSSSGRDVFWRGQGQARAGLEKHLSVSDTQLSARESLTSLCRPDSAFTSMFFIFTFFLSFDSSL